MKYAIFWIWILGEKSCNSLYTFVLKGLGIQVHLDLALFKWQYIQSKVNNILCKIEEPEANRIIKPLYETNIRENDSSNF